MFTWDKKLIQSITATLEEASLAYVNGVFIVQLRDNDTDFVLEYLKLNMGKTVGASATLMIREVFAKSKASGSRSGVLDYLLDNTDEKVPDFHIVTLGAEMLHDSCQFDRHFVLAQQLGHIVNGHLAVDKIIPYDSDEYHKREMVADKYALDLLKTKAGGIRTLDAVLNIVYTSTPEAMGLTKRQHDTVTQKLEQRLDVITMYQF